MKKIEIMNSTEMSEYLTSDEESEVIFPASSNILLTPSRVQTESLAEAESIALKSKRYLHMC